MSAFTEPLAQVRDELNRCAFGTESTTGLHDALSALDRVERLASDMEKAARELVKNARKEKAVRREDIEALEAVLSAREEGTA